MQAIILASGRGTRLSPLTDQLPKPLLPIANRPMLDYLLSTIAETGFSEILVTVGYASDQIRNYLTSVEVNCPITPIQARDWKLGPLASFHSVLSQLSSDTPCVLLPGDLYVSAANLHLLTTTTDEVALLYDPQKNLPGTLLQLNSSQHIQELTQSPVYLPDYHLALPALRATRQFFEKALTTNSSQPSTVFDLLQNWLRQGHSIQGIPIVEKGWCDVDTPANLITLNHYLLSTGWPPRPLPPGTYLPLDTSMVGPLKSATLTLGQDVLVEGPVLFGARVHVGDKCLIRDGTSLGAYTTVLANTELTRCITLPHTHVPSNAELTGTVLDAKGNVVH